MRRVSLVLLTAGAAAGLLVLVHVLAFDWGPGQAADRSVLAGFAGLTGVRTNPLLAGIAHLADPKPFTCFAVSLIALALVRGRPRTALAILVVCVGANITTQELKPALATFRLTGDSTIFINAGSWPSGHATASLALALCAVMAVPGRWRPVTAAAGAVFSIAVVFSLLAQGWHFPSDVVAGYLMAAGWTALAVAGVSAVDARWPRRARPSAPIAWQAAVRPAVLAALAALGAAGLLLLTRPGAVSAYAHAHIAFMVGAALIAALGLALAAGLAVTLRR